jgi:26S proteasome regulatory subunit N2
VKGNSYSSPVQVQLTQFALKKLDVVVDEFWAEISDSIQTIEVVYEDKMYPQEVSI